MRKLPQKLAFLTAFAFLFFHLGNCLAEGPLEDIISKYTAPILQGHLVEGATRPGFNSVLCYLDDSEVYTIDNGLFRQVRDSVLHADVSSLSRLNFDSIDGLGVSPKPQREMEGISEYPWLKKGTGSFREHVAQFKSVDFVELKAVDYAIDPEFRNQDGTFQKLTVLAKLDIRGRNSANLLTQEKAKLDVSLEKSTDGWSIKKIAVAQGLTQIQRRKPAFEDVTSLVGLDKVSRYKRTEAIRRGGYALAVFDYNHDGIPDLFIGQKGNAEVWLGSKDGTFKKIKTPLDQETFSKSAVFGDFNNDGNQEAVITRFLENGKKEKQRTQVAYYASENGVLTETPPKFGDPTSSNNPMPLAMGDFNGDGLLDVYVGYPGVQDFSVLGAPQPRALKEFQGLYLNDGKGGFTNATAALKRDGVKFNARIFPHSSLAIDFNQDGNLDLIVLDDRKNLSPAFVNDGHGKYHDSAQKLGLTNWNYAMGISAGDINNDGWVDLAYTNVNFNSLSRTFSSCKRHLAMGQLPPDPGLRIFRSENKAKNFVDVTTELGLEDVGEGAGSVTFLDYNDDGFQDIYVTNGLWSGTPDGQEFDSFFTTAIAMAQIGGPMYSLSPNDNMRFMDILSQFKGTLGSYLNAASVKAGNARPSLAGFQRNRLFRNNRDGTFSEVGYLEGVDSVADGYIAGKIDFNHDGKTDLILRNADPGTDEYTYPVVQLFKNTFKTDNKSVTLSFAGIKSNHEGLGLYAIAHAKSWKQVQHLEGNSGAMQQQHLLHFGLGKNPQIDQLEVFWPSGIKQVVKNVQPGYHVITEPTSAIGSKKLRPSQASSK